VGARNVLHGVLHRVLRCGGAVRSQESGARSAALPAGGADPITQYMLPELRRWPLQGADLLDIGGGIGVISMELARNGAASATLVEVSPAYLEVARHEVGSRYGSRPTQFLLGDFTGIAATLKDADVVTLDRVVCCYPDAEALLRSAGARARRLLAFTYPRDRWYMRTSMALQNFWRRFRGRAFRTFVHPPQRMGSVLEAAGLVRAARHETRVWVLELFHRKGAGLDA